MQLLNRSAEKGATTVFVAVMMVALLACVGLSADVGNMVYERSRIQNGADNAALAIARDCASKNPACLDGGQTTADDFVTKNSSADAAETPVINEAARTVTVNVEKKLAMNFLKLIDVDSKNLIASATASWTDAPTTGTVLPFAVSLCEYAKTAVGSPTVVRADTNYIMQDVIVPKNKKTLANVAYDNMAPYLAPQCDVPADVRLIAPGFPSQITMLQGGFWISGKAASLNNGKLLDTSILEALDSAGGFSWSQVSKFEHHLAVAKLLFFAIYAPLSNYGQAGLKLDGSYAEGKGMVEMKVIGYAPFEVSGWCLGLDKKGALDMCGGTKPASVGIAGKFIHTVQKHPEMGYGDGGTNFGATKVRLSG